MKVWRVLMMGVGVATLSLSGCTQTAKPGSEKAAQAKAIAAPAGVASPLRYSPAREGLPVGHIWKSQLEFGDVNGDGLPDLAAVSRLADGPWIWVGDGKGNWKPFANGLPREPFCGGGVDFGDANKDGKMDIAIADHCKGVFVFLGDGAGNWKESASGLPSIGAEDVAVGDFDKDGCLDIVSVASQEEGVRAFRGNCKGVWKEASDGLSLTEWGNAVELADVNGDGNLDIAAAYSAGPRVWLGDGKGKWREASAGLPAPDIHGLYWGLAAGDLNGDGKLDLVAGSQMPPLPEGCGAPGAAACSGGGVEVFLQQPDGSWRPSNQGVQPMNIVGGIGIGDINNDGHPDFVANGKRALNEIGGVYGVFPYLGDGKGNWTLLENTGLPNTGREHTWGLALADIDRDGVLDIASAFGDVVAPSWRSGAGGSAQGGAVQRGKFGSIEVWRGMLSR
jgi:hypothetical protein